MMKSLFQKTLFNTSFITSFISFFAGVLLLSASFFSASFSSEISEPREYRLSVSSFCSPQFVEVTPEKYSDIGEIETLSFTLQNNANPDSMSVKINNKDIPFSLEKIDNDRFSGIIDVSDAENGRQIVSLYAESNNAVHCSFREYIYILYKNEAQNIHYPSLSERIDRDGVFDPLSELFNPSVVSTPEISRPLVSKNIKITSPAFDSTIFTLSEDGQKISGIAPEGAKKIWVDFADEHGNTEHYFLRKFSEGDTTWNYFASGKYNNLSRGLNTYRVYAELENGEFSESETLILFFPEDDFTPEFSDTKNHWAKDAIHFLKSKGIVHGRHNGAFFPDASITKAESLKISTLSYNVKKHKYDTTDFSDVKKSDWFAEYASTAKAEKITGTEADTLLPENTVTERDAWNMIIDASLKNLDTEISQDKLKVTRAEFSEAVVKLMK